jgi:hypothetical protein
MPNTEHESDFGANALSVVAAPAWVMTVARLLDDAVLVPGTRFRFGADAIIGLFLPVAGDAVTGLGSVVILIAAWRARVPTVTLARMVMNIGIDATVGSIPVVGDAFDVVWKANRANIELLNRHAKLGEHKPRIADYLLVGIGVVFAFAVVALPLVVLALIVRISVSR